MNQPEDNLLSREWELLHKDFERYDRYGLLVKVMAVVVSMLCFIGGMMVWFALLYVLIFWLLEGIWRTVQGRTEARLLVVEAALKQGGDGEAMQLYSEWQAARPGAVSLVKEYVANSLRPTVAYPYVILLVVLFGLSL